ncbi:MAG: ribonuclease PH [Anaerolineae bacterium]|nr:ribonuclease PH [Anaerolineae bacterium]
MDSTNQRPRDALRPVSFALHYTRWAEGSVLCKFGQTHVLCNVTIEADLPRWLKEREQPHGWLTAEYQMLPRSTHRRRTEGLCPGGRVQEISRLIGRSLRMALDLHKLGERQLIVDCTVLQADGGTRTAAITGSWVAVALALQPLIAAGAVPAEVMRHQIAAISVGLVAGAPTLDLDYEADSQADVDLNVVMTADGDLVEVQGTGERNPFSRAALGHLLDLAAGGVEQLVAQQRAALNGAPTAGAQPQ